MSDFIKGILGFKTDAEKRAEDAARDAVKDQNYWAKEVNDYNNLQGLTQREFAQDNVELQREAIETSTLNDELALIQNFEDKTELINFEFDFANRVYDRSKDQAYEQKQFNEMAFRAAMDQQTVKHHEDMVGLAFEKGRSVLDFYANSTGLKVNRHNALVKQDIEEANNENKFQYGMATKKNAKRQAVSESQIRTQNAILEGMKAAGTLQSRGQGGRSSVKTVLGVMAESGAMRAGIANALMYAENSLDLDIAQLKDMQILDQTMVTAARFQANLDHDFGQSKLDHSFKLDNLMFDETEKSINRRNDLVKNDITNSLIQADMQANASILLEPQMGPMPRDPRTTAMAALNDDPETLDYIEMLPRATLLDIPEWVHLASPPEQALPERAPNWDAGQFVRNAGTLVATAATAGAGLAAAAGSGTFAGLSSTQFQYFAAAGNLAKGFGGR